MTVQFVVIGHDISSNAIGRALALTLVSEQIGPTSLFAFGAGATWQGSSQFPTAINRLNRRWKSQIKSALGGQEISQIVFWICKGIRPLDKVATWLSREYPQSTLILDLDDDDAGLAYAFREESQANRLKLNRFRAGHPRSISRSQAKIAKIARGFTFSTHALRAAYAPSWTPFVRVPHARPTISTGPPSRSRNPKTPRLTLGMFGTIRPHKGGDLMLSLLRHDSALRLMVFEHSGLVVPEELVDQVVLISSDTPLAEAYEQIDVALIALDADAPGSKLQLPAKLADAMRNGVPIVATATAPIVEIAGTVFHPLPDGAPASKLIAELRLAIEAHDREQMLAEFSRTLIPEAIAEELRRLLSDVLSDPHN